MSEIDRSLYMLDLMARRSKHQCVVIIVIAAMVLALVFTVFICLAPIPERVSGSVSITTTDVAGTTTTTHSAGGHTVTTITSADGRVVSTLITSGRARSKTKKPKKAKTPKTPKRTKQCKC